MKRLLVSILTISLVAGGAGFLGSSAAAATDEPIGFGMDANSIRPQTDAGVKPDYGVMWIGPWTLSSGWGGPGDRMTEMRNAGITPVIHFYYWGDDISPDCVDNGCWSSLHNTWKDQAGWDRLAKQLVDNLHKNMGGQDVVVIMETEFNKGGMNTHKPFDYQLRDKTNYIKWNYAGAKTVLGLGNWNRHNWDTWTESAKASHYIGVQAMRGSTKDSLSTYNEIYPETLAGAKHARSLYSKPVFITDIALSSYPEPEYLGHQRDNLKRFFDNMDDLKNQGVKAILYRTWYDQSTKNTANYYGQAERHFGLVHDDTKKWKSAASVWVNGVKAERSSGSSGSTNEPGDYSASFDVSSSVNEWWVDVKVQSDPKASQVHVRVDGGSWTALEKTSWGSWAKSTHVPKGSTVAFRATDPYGNKDYSGPMTWMTGSGGSGGYSATFSVSSSVNEWWVDVKVKSDPNPSQVHVRVDGGSWTALEKTSWGSWAKSMKVPKGSQVEFRATDSNGNRALSDTYMWLGSGDGSKPSSYSASFSPSSSVNEWWVDVKVKADPNPSKVHVRVDGGSWTALEKTSWGSWAKSLHAPAGSQVEFRATDSNGNQALSEVYTWLGFDAKFSVKGQGNNWWVESSVSSSQKITGVKACVDGSGCTSLSKTDWGSWARSFYVPSGSKVKFEAVSDSGAKATSSSYTW